VEDYLWAEVSHRAIQPLGIPYIATNVFNDVAHARHSKKIRISRGIESISADIGAKLSKPQTQPPTLEACMTGQENAATAPKAA
jgi:hypothetical protein